MISVANLSGAFTTDSTKYLEVEMQSKDVGSFRMDETNTIIGACVPIQMLILEQKSLSPSKLIGSK